ncbi:hypothetical protein BU24DRAFT_465651 [Aaosphaeria arxii CBS 175.79]|uniref:Uncharacterized protein n=1 Tax=Aaosphaeria arxii CBS 175.79 TaxID=1450172 RepID=A0A6A5XGW2_9PLEO|nr:uncharacterized protein BU24DRAFT_465651 [Aaosphaeria arxii CBS 175.79]KAF2012077.1 hypothetical protein BU24DRAFT_465651 [Aaosphaeria arxii CBS 175.79]
MDTDWVIHPDDFHTAVSPSSSLSSSSSSSRSQSPLPSPSPTVNRPQYPQRYSSRSRSRSPTQQTSPPTPTLPQQQPNATPSTSSSSSSPSPREPHDTPSTHPQQPHHHMDLSPPGTLNIDPYRAHLRRIAGSHRHVAVALACVRGVYDVGRELGFHGVKSGCGYANSWGSARWSREER